MSTPNNLRVFALLLACAAFGAPAIAAKGKAAPTIRDLQSRQIEVRPDSKVDGSAVRAMENYRRFLELQNTDPALRAEALRRLGDLSLESGELERMEKEVTQIDVAGAEAIRLYGLLIKAYPDYPRNDRVLYQLARAYETTGQREQALATLDNIVSRYPRAPQLDEVQFRRGEILFSSKRFKEAEQAYSRTLSAGAVSPYYKQALYKHGWSLFKQGLTEDSLESFAGVLDANLVNKQGAVRRFEDLPRADREIAEDAMRVMSITFTDLEAAVTLDKFVAKRKSMPYAWLLYSRLGDLLVDKERYQDAASTYRAFATRDPNSEYSPGLSMQAIEAYRKGGFNQLVLDGKREYVEHYRFSGDYWQNRDRAKYPEVVKELKTNLKDVAEYFHASAQTSKRGADFDQAARWYRDLLESFPDDADAAKTRYSLADTLFENHDYAGAVPEYEKAAYDYPRSEQSPRAAYAAIVASQKHEESLAGQAKSDWHARATDAGVKFASEFPAHPESAVVLTRAAQDIYGAGDLPRAITIAQQLLARDPPVDAPKQRIGHTIVGQSKFNQGDFAAAEASFIRARDLATEAAMRTDLTERLAESVYKQAEAKQKDGDAAGAVEDFLRVARVAPDSKVRPTAEFDAAASLINLKQWERAIEVLERYRRDYPKNERAADVTRKLAVAYTEAHRPGDAAPEFERIWQDAAESADTRREALVQAADLYGKANNTAKALTLLERFVTDYPTPVEPAVEARQKLSDAAASSGKVDRQFFWLREIVAADLGAGAARSDRTKYLAAKARLALAAPLRDKFMAVRLVAPLKKSLAAKRSALESALKAYKEAAEYRVAEVTTATTYEIAELYRSLGRDIIKSERPKGLKRDEREQYDSLLEEQAYPFEEKAIATHEVNAELAHAGIFDESVQKSFNVLAELKPARYAKTEWRAPNGTPAGGVDSSAALTEQGVALRSKGDFAGAKAAYLAAIASDPTFAPAHRNLGVLLDLYMNDLEPALAQLVEYQQLSGEDKPVSSWIVELKQRVAKAAPKPEAPPANDAAPADGAAPVNATGPASSDTAVPAPGNTTAPAGTKPPGGAS